LFSLGFVNIFGRLQSEARVGKLFFGRGLESKYFRFCGQEAKIKDISYIVI
jgi:hypothetical protein